MPQGRGPQGHGPQGPLSHRQLMPTISGLILALFVSMLSSTVVTNALPQIIADLHGSSVAYTWVMVGTMLAMTATMPIWGKLADLLNKKVLVQVALLIYVGGSALAGLSVSSAMLIGCRVLQGLALGGLVTLVQTVIAVLVPPRERGRYNGYMGSAFAVATVSGPLIGGLIVDTPWLGWRWCFYLPIPLAAAAFILLQRTLHLPVTSRKASIDYVGATLIAGGVSAVLIWLSLAGDSFPWRSAQSAGLLGGGLAMLLIALFVETRVPEPVVPLRLFRNPTVVLAVIASMSVGSVMFNANLVFGQYFQLGQGRTPTVSGLLTVPLVAGLAVSSTVVGQLISRTGTWKRYLIIGTALIGCGCLLLTTIGPHTPPVLVSLFASFIGLGLGMTQQNLVLAAQNSAPVSELGVTSATVSFFRSLGGSTGVAALGAFMAHRVSEMTVTGLAERGLPPDTLGDGRSIPDLATLPEPVAEVVHTAYGSAPADVFGLTVPLAVIALLAVAFIPARPLRATAHAGPDDSRPDGARQAGRIGDRPGQQEKEAEDDVGGELGDASGNEGGTGGGIGSGSQCPREQGQHVPAP